jgi:hypothetical protein
VPPSAPVVNPAPPSGSAARKEAKQRQAATAKSEETGNAEAQEQLGGDRADAPPQATGAHMTRHEPNAATRHEPVRPRPSITPLRVTAQPSAWPRDLLYGGGIGLAAAVLALGLTVAPAPAWVRDRSRRRRAARPGPRTRARAGSIQ